MNIIRQYWKFILIPLLSVGVIFGPKAWPYLFPLIVVGLWRYGRVQDGFSLLKSLPLLLLSTLMIWAFITCIWSTSPEYGFPKVPVAAFLALLSVVWARVLSGQETNFQDHLMGIVKAIFIGALILWVVEAFTDSYVVTELLRKDKFPVTPAKIHNAILKPTAFAMGIFSFVIIGDCLLKRKKAEAFLYWVAVLILCAKSSSTTALLGEIAGGVTIVFCYLLKGRLGWPLMISVGAFNLFLPLIIRWGHFSQHMADLHASYGESVMSFYHRTVIWEFTVQKWLEKPYFGWGAWSSRVIPGGDEEFLPGFVKLSLHPHNYALQVFLELGVVGAALFTAFLMSVIWTIHAYVKTVEAKAMAYGLFMGSYVFCSAEHSLWHLWMIAWISAAVGFVIFRVGTRDGKVSRHLKG